MPPEVLHDNLVGLINTCYSESFDGITGLMQRDLVLSRHLGIVIGLDYKAQRMPHGELGCSIDVESFPKT